MTRGVLRAAGLLVAGASLLLAQETRERPADPMSRLDPQTRYAVELLLDSAQRAGLPYGPLESKALEGIAKRASAREIVAAVRRVYRTLREARASLGPAATADELTAAANVLRVGIRAADLTQLAATRNGKPLTIPLVVLADLVWRGVPKDTASSTILQLWRDGAADDDFLGLWRGVERDIVSGTDPGVALLNRARLVPPRGPPSAPTNPGVRPDGS